MFILCKAANKCDVILSNFRSQICLRLPCVFSDCKCTKRSVDAQYLLCNVAVVVFQSSLLLVFAILVRLFCLNRNMENDYKTFYAKEGDGPRQNALRAGRLWASRRKTGCFLFSIPNIVASSRCYRWRRVIKEFFGVFFLWYRWSAVPDRSRWRRADGRRPDGRATKSSRNANVSTAHAKNLIVHSSENKVLWVLTVFVVVFGSVNSPPSARRGAVHVSRSRSISFTGPGVGMRLPSGSSGEFWLFHLQIRIRDDVYRIMVFLCVI